MSRSYLGIALAAVLFGSGTAAAQKLDVESLARMPDITGVDMSAEGRFHRRYPADPRDSSKRVIATSDISRPTARPLDWTVTPGDRMSFVAAQALKGGKVLAIGSQIWTGNLAGCGEGKTTGATKTYLYKFYLSDKTIKDFKDPYAGRTRHGCQRRDPALPRDRHEPADHDLPLDLENVIVRRRRWSCRRGRLRSWRRLRPSRARSTSTRSTPAKVAGLHDAHGRWRRRCSRLALGAAAFGSAKRRPESKRHCSRSPASVRHRSGGTLDTMFMTARYSWLSKMIGWRRARLNAVGSNAEGRRRPLFRPGATGRTRLNRRRRRHSDCRTGCPEAAPCSSLRR